MVICAILQASKGTFDRSSPHGLSSGAREFAEIFFPFFWPSINNINKFGFSKAKKRNVQLMFQIS
jgi:hypothetical protein